MYYQSRELGLKKGEIYKVVRSNEIANCEEWDNATKHEISCRGIVNGRPWVPFRKGDPEGNKWFADEPLFILWTRENVDYLSSSKDARWQGQEFFFQRGITWTRGANHTSIKCRLQKECIFDVNAMRLTPLVGLLSADTLLSIFNSDIFSYILKKFVAHTWMVQINDIRQMPLIIPTKAQAGELQELASHAIEAKTLGFSEQKPQPELLAFCRAVSEKQKSAPEYLRPPKQLKLITTPEDCLIIIELAVHWAVERLYGVEGHGPFNEF